MTQKALILAHYNSQGRLRKDTLDVLDVFHEYFDKILLISTNFDEAEKIKLPSYVELHIRENVGYDFYSYRYGLARLLEGDDAWQVTLMNTSFVVFDPVRFYKIYIKKYIEKRDFDCFGLTKSQEGCAHLQSFLITFSDRVVKDEKFMAWWDAMVPLSLRQQVIDTYELGLSQHLSVQGYRLDAAFDAERLIRASNNFWRTIFRWSGVGEFQSIFFGLKLPLLLGRSSRKKIGNPSHANYEDLMDCFGVIKIEVFKSNPFKLDLRRLDKMMRESEEFKKVIMDGMSN